MIKIDWHNIMVQYFDGVKLKWLPTPSKVYLVKTPIAIMQSIPALREQELIAHRTIGQPPTKERAWAVSHKNTSYVIAQGRTRAEAITNAHDVLLRHGNKVFLLAIKKAEAKIAVLRKKR